MAVKYIHINNQYFPVFHYIVNNKFLCSIRAFAKIESLLINRGSNNMSARVLLNLFNELEKKD